MINDTLADFYLKDYPPGVYHRRDDAPGSLCWDGQVVLEVIPCTELGCAMVAAMVCLLNKRGEVRQ